MPPLAEVDWTVIVSALGSAAVAVVGAIGWQVYRVKSARWAFERGQKLADEEAQEKLAAGERQARRDILKEHADINKRLREDGLEWRETVHELRNENQVLKNKDAILEERLTICEHDREDLHDQVDDMAEALEANGIKVFRRPPRHRSDPIVPHGPGAAHDADPETEVEE